MPPANPVLYFLAGPNAGRRYELIDGEYIIGRRSDCQVFVPDMRVSRQHARIYRDGDVWRIEDLGSNNGTQINGRNIQSAALSHDDEIRVAENRIRVDMPGARQGDERDSSVSLVDMPRADVYISGMYEPVRPGAPDRLPLPADPRPAGQESGRERLLERKLHALQSILEIAARVAEPDELMQSVVEQLLVVFPRAHTAGVLVENERTGRLEVRCHETRDAGGQIGRRARFGSDLEVPRTIIDIVVRDHRGVLLSEGSARAAKDEAPATATANLRGKPFRGPNPAKEPNGSRMGAPLTARNHHYGVMYMECSDQSFRQEDLDLLTSIAAHTGLAIHAARMHGGLLERGILERDLKVARQIQRSLSSAPPQVHGLEFAVHYEAAYQIGGDFYDFIWHDNEHLGVMVGDVSGKAISAALYMARLTSEIRGRVGIAQTPRRLLERVNEEMVKLGDDGMFATLVYAVYDLEHRILAYTNAGHCRPLLKRGGEVFPVHDESAHVPPVGVFPNIEIGEAQVQLYQGDLLVIVSDGVLEARDAREQEYGEERLARCMRNAPANAAAMVEAIVEDVDRHVANGTQSDDITVLAMQVSGKRAERASSTISGYAMPDAWDGRG